MVTLEKTFSHIRSRYLRTVAAELALPLHTPERYTAATRTDRAWLAFCAAEAQAPAVGPVSA